MVDGLLSGSENTMATDPQQVSATLVELADTLVSDYDVFDYLDRLLEHSTAALGAAAGGVMLVGKGHAAEHLELLASTDERTRVLELFELQRQEGPCVDSYRLGAPVVEEDLARADRWPRFSAIALEGGYQAVYAFPLRLRGSVIGALNLFRDSVGAAAPADIVVAQAFADMATIGILQERGMREARELAAQLQTALNSRIVIEQAKGVIAERLDCDMEQSYQALRWYARDRNIRLRALAASVVDGDPVADDLVRSARPRP
jgi:GAF domain-containing protein